MKTWSHLLWVVLTVLILLPCLASAEGSVRAEVDRTSMDPGDVVILSVVVKTDGDADEIQDPTLPDLPGFEVVKQWSDSSGSANIVMTPQGTQYIRSTIKTFHYALQANQQGRYTIGGVTVNVQGQRFVTGPKQVNVVPGGSGSPGNQRQQRQQQQRGQQDEEDEAMPGFPPGFPKDLFDDEDDVFSQLLRRRLPPTNPGSRTLPINPNEAFFVQLETDKTSVYQDEQVTASWYLYTRSQIRDLDTLKYPSLSGFWKEDIEIATQLNFQQEIVNGVPYRKALLASFALFPIKPGVAVVDEYKVRCSVFDSLDAFGMFSSGQARQLTKSSSRLKIDVKPLPTDGQPQDFSGAVGNFQIAARVDDPNVVVGEPFTLRIRFEGKGNAKRIDLPPLKLPESLELYETEKEAKFFRTGTSYRDFNVLIIPRQEGDLTVPAISASIFDPVAGKYVTVSTDPIMVKAARGTGKSGPGNSRVAGRKKTGITENSEPALATNYEDGQTFMAGREPMVLSALYVLISLGLLWRARTELGWGQRKRDLNRRIQTRFGKINDRVAKSDWRGVGVEVTNTVYFVLGEISGQGGANVELEKLMLRAPPSVRRELAEPVMKLMDSFQALSFAPDEVVKNLRNPEQVKKLVSDMHSLMQKAVSLGLNAERDGASEASPTAS